MNLRNDGHTETSNSSELAKICQILEPYPPQIGGCEHCGCFRNILYVESQMVCEECFSQME